MDEVRILEIKQSVFANNDQRAELLRRELKEKRIFLLNLMSSPGSGKTTTLTRTIERLRDEFKIGVMEADIDSDVDARTIAATGVKSIQLHTGGMCHLDADMTKGKTLNHCVFPMLHLYFSIINPMQPAVAAYSLA